jgi:MFS family permease
MRTTFAVPSDSRFADRADEDRRCEVNQAPYAFGRKGLRTDTPGKTELQGWRLVLCVFLPFAAGYYLSYLFRSINGLISDCLTAELGLGAADIGLLTSVYFLVLAAAQIPIGMLLDRFGPRRVQSALLLLAAVGAALFARSDGLFSLMISRALIGLGVAAALTAGLKAVILWFPRERVALVNGYMIMLGALGAVSATAPAEFVLSWTGWRGLFDLLALTTAVTAVLIHVMVPERPTAAPTASAAIGLKTIYTDMRFWKVAPLSAVCIGSAWSLQGLWASSWLTDVDGFSRPSVVAALFAMGMVLSISAWLLGTIANRLRSKGIGPETLLAAIAALFIAAQLALVMRLPLPPIVPWLVIGLVGASTVLSFAIIAEYFPPELAGRANGALNVLHFSWGFLAQFGTGWILSQWPLEGGHYPLWAYQIAFGANVVLQLIALGWFVLPDRQALAEWLASPQDVMVYFDWPILKENPDGNEEW